MADLINKKNEDGAGGSTLSEPLRRAIGDRYLTYALSTIMHRALPDARDGLKPVHRRILYAMYRLKLVSNGKFLKSAKFQETLWVISTRMVMLQFMTRWQG